MSGEARRAILDYYRITADSYDGMHVDESGGHYIALNHISSFVRILDISTMLDVGCGTGRGVGYMVANHSDVVVKGVDISKDLLAVAVHRNEIPPDYLLRGDGYFLPFRDEAFDAVCELGILHHVKNPNWVVEEMLRVAKKAIFISDSNRFGQGGLLKKVGKLALYKVGLWEFVNLIKTKGKGYSFSDGDGVAFSYSVFDSIPLLKKECQSILAIPTGGDGDLLTFPLLSAPKLLVCAIKSGYGY